MSATMDDLLVTYTASRGCELGDMTTTGRKVAEEAVELVIEIVKAEGALTDSLMCELADVVLSAAVVARNFGTTVEECIALKTELDRGRG